MICARHRAQRASASESVAVSVARAARPPVAVPRARRPAVPSPSRSRVPKLKGFRNPFRVEYQVVNLDTLQESDLDEVSPETLLSKGLVSKGSLVKVLGRGELSRKVTVKAHAFSKSAEAAITAAGGTVEVLDKPFGVRPAFHGSAHTNR